MLSPIQRGRKCALCAFLTSEWLAHSLPKQYGARFASQLAQTDGIDQSKRHAAHFKKTRSRPEPGLPGPPFRRLIPENAVPSKFTSHSTERSIGRGGRPAPHFRSHDERKIQNVTRYSGNSGSRSLVLRSPESTTDMFRRVILEQAKVLGYKLRRGDDPSTAAWGLEEEEELDSQLKRFTEKLQNCLNAAAKQSTSREQNPLFFRLRNAFLESDMRGLQTEMKYALLESVVTSRLSSSDVTNSTQQQLADLRHPIEWFPATRAIHRTVHLHVGPTNSGKTYHALKRLEAAESGIYAGPLRLLAHEVYTRLNACGKKCALITGEERRIPEDMMHVMNSCTVEMVPLNTDVDVAVIDEIQMMADIDRGWAWTQAFLGVKAKEVHLCGELRTVDLVTKLCKLMGDKLVVHRYQRLSPLETEAKSLDHDLSKLQKGDAIILFSRLGIHGMKAAVEAETKRRCAVVYGGLPPETRAQQAALFNDPNNDYDFLVASDAVGMGLNLSIKRIIFESTSKNDGSSFRQIQTSEIKQIAGRAGRYKTVHDAVKADSGSTTIPLELDLVPKPEPEPNRGYITTLDKMDLHVVRRAMSTEAKPLKTAGIFPPEDTIIRFASYFPPDTPFSYIVSRLHDIAVYESDFQMCRLKEQLQIADLIQPFKLTIFDRITFIAAPVALREPGFYATIQEFAACVADQSGGELLDLKSLKIELLAKDIHDHPEGSKGYLREAETLHKSLTLYLWLSYRFDGVFRSQALCFHVKSLVEDKIDQCLAEVQWDTQKSKRQNAIRRMAVKESQARNLAADELTDADCEAPVNTSVTSREEGGQATDFEELSGSQEVADSDDSPTSDANLPVVFESGTRDDKSIYSDKEVGESLKT